VTQTFRAMDTNHDGVVTQDEFQAYLVNQPAGEPGEHRSLLDRASHVGQHWFEHADAKGDGHVTLDEAMARPMQAFEMADANHDGVIDPDEQQAAMAMMGMGHHRH
jgi:Ca2+-binding EF-hand superfamily protein